MSHDHSMTNACCFLSGWANHAPYCYEYIEERIVNNMKAGPDSEDVSHWSSDLPWLWIFSAASNLGNLELSWNYFKHCQKQWQPSRELQASNSSDCSKRDGIVCKLRFTVLTTWLTRWLVHWSLGTGTVTSVSTWLSGSSRKTGHCKPESIYRCWP